MGEPEGKLGQKYYLAASATAFVLAKTWASDLAPDCDTENKKGTGEKIK
jgi:hypothetical protein